MPSEELIVADSSPLIGLAWIGHIALLPRLARRIVVPPAVWHEVTSARGGIYISKELLESILKEACE